MYIDRVREYIKQMEEHERSLFMNKLHEVFQARGKNVRRKDLNRYVEGFLLGVPPRMEYFEAYLETLDTFGQGGAIHVLSGKTSNIEFRGWIELMRTITNGEMIDPDARKHLEHEFIVVEVNALLQTVINYCSDSNIRKFEQNLHDFVRFLTIRFKK